MQTYTQGPREVRIPPKAAGCLAVIGIIMSLGWQQKQTLRSVEFCLPKQEVMTAFNAVLLLKEPSGTFGDS